MYQDEGKSKQTNKQKQKHQWYTPVLERMTLCLSCSKPSLKNRLALSLS